MDTYNFMFYCSWSHIIIEVGKHFTPESCSFKTLKTSELLIPEIYLAVKAFNPVIAKVV